MALPQCNLSFGQVQEAFLAAPPLVSQTILDLTIKQPTWLRDIFQVEEWPLGAGTLMEQLIFRGMMPKIERGFDKWRKLQNNTGCDPCDGPDCSYTWTEFGGHGMERKITELMGREFRSPSYCIAQIQTTAHFREVFAKVVENLYAQVNFFKEINVGQNFLTGLAKKYVVDSGGPKPNTQNPYVYRNIGTTTLAALNITLLEFFYEFMRRMPSAVPYDVVDGSPIFALVASHQVLAHLYRDDPQLRQDVRFSGMANDMLMKYNFMSTIRGMFIAAPVLYPRRFTITAGEPVEVLPFVNDVPLEVGAYTEFNPAYEAATHEEVLLHGKFPFKIFFMPTAETLGQNTSFGPEFSWFNSWSWINPLTIEDPFRRVGYFATSAKIGLSQQFSDAIFGILVERPSVSLTAQYNPPAVCPPVDPNCDNEVPVLGCPCPLILSVTPNPITPGNYFIQLATPVDVDPQDTLDLGLDTGGYVTATVVASSADDTNIEVTLPQGTDIGICDHFVTIFCDDTRGCSANVLSYTISCTDPEDVVVILGNAIKADVGETVTIFLGNGTSISGVIDAVDPFTNTYTIDTGANFCDNVGGLVSVCVPPATDATCPDCGPPVCDPCVNN